MKAANTSSWMIEKERFAVTTRHKRAIKITITLHEIALRGIDNTGKIVKSSTGKAIQETVEVIDRWRQVNKIRKE